MNPINKRQLCLFALALLLPVVFFFAAYRPLKGKCRRIKDENQAVKNVIEQSQALKEKLPMVKREIARLEKEAADFEKKIPQNRDLGYFLQQITEYMNNSNLGEQYVAPGSEVTIDDLHCIPVVMRCTGRLEDIYSFYRSLQDMGRLVKIESLNLENDKDLKGNVRMETQALIYYRIEQGKR